MLYPKGYRTKILASLPSSQLVMIRACVSIGYTIETLMERFKLTQKQATILYLEYKPDDTDPNSYVRLGRKDEPYYDKEIPKIPKYRLKDLKGEEAEIAKKDTSTKLWTWEE